MKPPVARPVRRVPWYRKKRFVQVAGSITGFLFMTWLSIFIVYHSSRSADNSLQSSLQMTNIDKDSFMSSFHPIYHPLHQVESYYWPKDASLFPWLQNRHIPAVVSIVNLPEWQKLYRWASGSDWVVKSDVEYDFQVQNTPVFRTVRATSPFTSSVPLPLIEGEATQYLRLNDFFKIEFGEILPTDGSAKFKRFEGFLNRKSDNLREFHDAPANAEFDTELKDRSIKVTLTSHHAQTLPYLSLSGQIIMQAVGTSDWLLSAPKEAQKYRFYPSLHPLGLQTQLGANQLSATGLYGIDLDSDILTEGAHDPSTQASDIASIDVDFIRLIPGQILYIPPFWTAQSLASATSVTISTDLSEPTDLEERLKAIRIHPKFAALGNLISEVMKQEMISNLNKEAEADADSDVSVDPEVWLREKILSLIRILKSSLADTDWKADLLDSYETFHTQIVVGKGDFAHRVIVKACSISEVISGGDSQDLDSKLRKTLFSAEQEISALLKHTLAEAPDRRIASSLIAESALFATLQDADVIHGFLHECHTI